MNATNFIVQAPPRDNLDQIVILLSSESYKIVI